FKFQPQEGAIRIPKWGGARRRILSERAILGNQGGNPAHIPGQTNPLKDPLKTAQFMADFSITAAIEYIIPALKYRPAVNFIDAAFRKTRNSSARTSGI